jgi:hypothetical protein
MGFLGRLLRVNSSRNVRLRILAAMFQHNCLQRCDAEYIARLVPAFRRQQLTQSSNYFHSEVRCYLFVAYWTIMSVAKHAVERFDDYKMTHWHAYRRQQPWPYLGQYPKIPSRIWGKQRKSLKTRGLSNAFFNWESVWEKHSGAFHYF